MYELLTNPSINATIATVSALVALLAVLVDRWVSERERRASLLRALHSEVLMNLGALASIKEIDLNKVDPRAIGLPRFFTATLQATISSGLFVGPRDRGLWTRLHEWLQRATEMNARLEVSEVVIVVHPEMAKRVYEEAYRNFEHSIARDALLDLRDFLGSQYSRESEIDEDTEVFEV